MDISVVIPCYNRERSIGRAIRSVLDQKLAALEIVVVDDGSQDGSAEAAAAFGAPVRVVQQANAGPSAARNRGIALARGGWVAFLDSDDVWSPSKLALQAEAARRFPAADLVFCDTEVRSPERVLLPSRFELGHVLGREVERQDGFALYDRTLFASLVEGSRVITSAVMVRRELPGLAFREDLRTSEDWELWLRLVLGHPFASVDRVLVTMYQQGDNLSAADGPTCRSDVRVLEELAREPVLSDDERQCVGRALARRRFEAMYASLVEGETRAARSLLRALPGAAVGRVKYPLYWLATLLPGPLLRSIAARRLAEPAARSEGR